MVTITVPVVAPVGTVAFMYVSDSTVNGAALPLNVTMVEPVSQLPRMAMRAPVFAATGTV